MSDSLRFTVDLNADVGESLPDASPAIEQELMPWITSASVAAGFHGGNPSVIRDTIRVAKAHGVAVGAHPSFPDREGFGRRHMNLPGTEVEDLVLYQVAAVAGVAAAEGVSLHHVKPHGALYNMAARDRALAAAIVRGIVAVDRTLLLYAPPASELLIAGQDAGVQVVAECFADRGYEADGSLTPRTTPGAVINDPVIVAARVMRMVEERVVETRDGSMLKIDPQTICIHSDTSGAARLARELRTSLERAGVRVRPA
jgi:UPF0271 protein